MPLLIVVLLGAVVLWLLLSIFFEKIGGVTLKITNMFKGKLNEDNNGEEKSNE